jgi:hypothetical protein
MGLLKALKLGHLEKPCAHYVLRLFHHYLAWISFGFLSAKKH